MASDRMKELRKKFQTQADTSSPTPENQFGKIRKSKEEQAKAARVAKARAARYNMTLRALAIQTNLEVKKQDDKERQAKVEIQKRAAKYNMTSRALPVASVITPKDQDNLGKALAIDVSPVIAKEVLAAVAKKEAHAKQLAPTIIQATNVQKQQLPKEQTPPNTNTNKPAKTAGKELVMEGLQVALKSGDDQAIDKAILAAFLETNAPHLLPRLDDLLAGYKSRMSDLFSRLANDYPDAHDAQIAGEQKAHKELTDAMQNNPTRNIKPAKLPVNNAAKPVKPEPEKLEPLLEGLDDEESSLIVDSDKAFEVGYNNVIKQAELDPENTKRISSLRRLSVMKNDLELVRELKHYHDEEQELKLETEKEKEKPVKETKEVKPIKEIKVERKESIQSENSLVAVEENYIVSAVLQTDDDDNDSLKQTDSPSNDITTKTEEEEEEKEKEVVKKEEKSRWAVQLETKNYALKQKLMKQGLSKNQVEELVNNLDSNTSEML